MRKAFTLIELIVVVAIVAILIAIVAGGVRGCANRGPAAEESMREYVAKLYPGREIIGVACTNVDTDGDGYISCTATIDTDDGPSVVERQINAQCATGFLSWNSGCKASIPQVYPQQ
jgi:prepilin-type N-terminal cleavage/methylation domain-containing protein